ncbi:MAG: sialidase family protein [Candidatus Latescibacterota bacterium]
MEIFESIVCPASDEHPRNSEASMVALAGGRLLLAWSDFSGDSSDFAQARISAKVSSDGGRTWGAAFPMRENVGKMNVYPPGFLRLHSGEIGLSYGIKDSQRSLRPHFVRSADEGATWTDPVCMVQGLGHFELDNDRLIQTRGGLLIAPMSWSLDVLAEGVNFKAFCSISEDNGHTWRQGKGQMEVPGLGADEPTVLELVDGRILMFARTDQGCIYQSWSEDGGETWTQSEPTPLVSPGIAPVSLKRIQTTGDILVVWNRGDNRNPITAALSRDEALSWEHFRDIDHKQDESYAYPSIAFVGDEVLITYYTRHQKTFGHLSLKLKIIPLAWFYQDEGAV